MEVKKLSEIREPQRRRAVAIAGYVGDVSLAEMSLNDVAPSVAASALRALARLEALTVQRLEQALQHPSPTVRRAAADLTAQRPEIPAEYLVTLLRDEDALVVDMAAWACGERPPNTLVVEALAAVAIGHEEPLCREAAVAALGALGEPSGLPAILIATNDKPAVRRRAVLALAPFEGPAVDEALATARLDRDWQVRQAAEDLG